MPKLWGSRFKGTSDKLADEFSYSINYDYRLAKYDVVGSIAHAQMLEKCKIISRFDAFRIVSGLKRILAQINKGTFKPDSTCEDIHTQIQLMLKSMIGASADKLHTARSRNDLIALDVRMYCKDEINDIQKLIHELQKTIIKLAEKEGETIIPGFTHLQPAQIVLLAHHLLAYVEMFDRDKNRLDDCYERTDSMPLGSGALSGSSLPIDRAYVAKLLGFSKITQNSMDAVSDRDFVIELLSDLALIGMHASRIAEEFIIWSSEFSYVEIDWSLCTGSSIMPHKKNPDMLELIRGESATLISNLNQVLILMKGLPLTYNRDMQLDKPPLFESVEKIKYILKLLTKTFETIKFNESIVNYDSSDEEFFSVDVVEYLIKKGVSYREAHDVVGRMFKEVFDQDITADKLTKEELKKYHPKFDLDVKTLFNPKMSVKIKQSLGSTNPKMVAQQINHWKKKLK